LAFAIPLGLIANELISNACKHAFSGREAGNLSLRLKGEGAQTLQFFVRDDGVGMPTGFEIGAAKSLGLPIVRNLARQIRATLSCPNVEGGGTCIGVSLKYGE
jgi:two-component sensor histidine kinase